MVIPSVPAFAGTGSARGISVEIPRYGVRPFARDDLTMSIPKDPSLVKFVTSVIYADPMLREEGISLLKKRWGEVDLREDGISFFHTDYYAKEFGSPLFRSFFSFKRLYQREDLVAAKLFSNGVENRLAKGDGQRSINIDPGYLTDGQLVLATGKNYSHRIYLGEGIFADLTLIYKEGGYQSLPWTYPDYKEAQLQMLLLKMREIYLYDKTP